MIGEVGTAINASIFGCLIIAGLIDYWEIGTDGWTNKAPFWIALPSLTQGFEGSSVDKALTRIMTDTSGSIIAESGMRATATDFVKWFTLAVWVYAILCALPEKWKGKMGRARKMKFDRSGRFNTRSWVCAGYLAVMGSTMTGLAGASFRTVVDILSALTAALPTIVM